MSRVLHDILEEAAAAVPDKEAIFHKSSSMSYAAVCLESRRLDNTLRAGGIAKGDRIAVYMEKCCEKVVSIFGISMAGAVFVPVNKIATSPQAAHVIRDSGARVLITTYGRLPKIAEVAKELPDLEWILALGPGRSEADLGPIRVLDWREALAGHPVPSANAARIVETDLAAILYTSGSTGKPKGVVLSHLNIMAGARSVSEFLKITAEDRLLSILTFGFDYGLNQLITAFLKRAQIVLLEFLFQKDIILAIPKYRITGLAAVAATWNQLAAENWKAKDNADIDVSSLRYITNSGGAIAEANVRTLRRKLPNAEIFLMYGLTEAFRSTYLDPSLVDERPTSIGKAVPGEEILVLDDQNRPVKPGEIGELVHRGVFVAQGYWNAPDLTALRYRRNPMQPPEVPIPEMVVYSGDRVRIDAQGFMYFVGRNDEMIKCAGNRISPTEVEEVLYATGWVHSAAAFGIPHEVYGQAVLLAVAPVEGRNLDEAEILAYCKKTMPAYMVPQKIEIWPDFPRNVNGKLDRSLIKKQIFEKLGIAGK
jgi:acyl-CoA ligase (AMP-forming) (exosortase A-associated)